jgi:hypothetical protein
VLSTLCFQVFYERRKLPTLAAHYLMYKCVTQGANENNIPKFSRLVSKLKMSCSTLCLSLAVWLFWFCLFWSTNEKNLLQREKNTTGQARPQHKGAIGILTPHNLKAKIARLWVII